MAWDLKYSGRTTSFMYLSFKLWFGNSCLFLYSDTRTSFLNIFYWKIDDPDPWPFHCPTSICSKKVGDKEVFNTSGYRRKIRQQNSSKLLYNNVNRSSDYKRHCSQRSSVFLCQSFYTQNIEPIMPLFFAFLFPEKKGPNYHLPTQHWIFWPVVFWRQTKSNWKTLWSNFFHVRKLVGFLFFRRHRFRRMPFLAYTSLRLAFFSVRFFLTIVFFRRLNLGCFLFTFKQLIYYLNDCSVSVQWFVWCLCRYLNTWQSSFSYPNKSFNSSNISVIVCPGVR